MRRALRRHATLLSALLALGVLPHGLALPAEATEATEAARGPATAVTAPASSVGIGPTPAPSARLNRTERAALFDALEKVWALAYAKQWGRCLEGLQRIEPLARRDWTHTGMSWQGGRMHCELERRVGAGAVPSTALFDEITAPALAHVASAPAGAERRTGARLDLLRQRWRLMIAHGLAAQAEREELDAITQLFERARGQPPTGPEHEDLERWASGFYGQHNELARALHWERWVAERHGATHFTLLHIQRAQSFTYRATGRDAEALAVMNQAAAMAAEHHASNERLRMLVAGERAPAMTANGLLVEARAEILLLRQWMLRHPDAHRGNLMRMNYHLAGIALGLGDFDAAIAHSDEAIEHATKSELPNDLIESGVARMIRAEARVLRGDAGAVEGLKEVLAGYNHRDSNSGAPAFTLAKQAARTGDAALQQWAHEFIARHAAAKLQPMQAARALADVAGAWASAQTAPAAARALLARALVRSLPERDPAVSVQAAFAWAHQLAPTQPDAAIWLYKRGANALQALRNRAAVPDEGLHRAWLADHEADLRRFIGLLIDQGRLPEAQEAIRVLREEELHEFTRRSGTSRRAGHAGNTGRAGRAAQAEMRRPLAFAPHEQQQQARLAPLAERVQAEQALADARAKPVPAPQVGTEREWFDDPQTDQRLAEFTDEVQQLVATMAAVPANAGDGLAGAAGPSAARGSRARSADAARSAHAAGSVRSGDSTAFPAARAPAAGQRGASGLMPPTEARLRYFVRADQLDIVVEDHRGHHRSRVAIPQSQLNSRIHAWRQSLTHPHRDALPDAQQLYDWLIRPVAARLANARTVHIAADGALRYVPFAALHDGRRFLAERHVLTMALDVQEARPAQELQDVPETRAPPASMPPPPLKASVQVAQALRSPPSNQSTWSAHSTGAATAHGRMGARPWLAAFGRATGDDEHTALPGVAAELAALQNLRALPVRTASDGAFTGEALHQALLQQPSVVHLASHFVMRAGDEAGSYLLLGDGTRLTLAQLARLPWGAVRLVLLSACDSGVADSPAQGRQFTGLAGVLRRAGAASVLATLWPVSDGATAQWMAEFYAPWRQGATHAAALPQPQWAAAAQRRWLTRHAGTALAHPHYWAGFAWMGR